MRPTLQTFAGVVVLVVCGTAVPAYPESAVTFAAEVFAAPSYHLLEIPKVEEGGEGFTWSYLNQQPESWGRALMFWPGPTTEATLATSVPQSGPTAGYRWKSPGAWSSYPTGGESRGLAQFGEPPVPLGTTVETPGGKMQILSFSGRAGENEGVAETAFGSFESNLAPVTMTFGGAFSSATREEGAAVSSGWAVARNVQLGDVTIDEIRSDASVRATAGGETGTWKLTITGVTVGEQRLEWTNNGVSFAPGSDAPLKQLNAEMAKGAEGLRSEFQLVPGRVWRDDAGTHVHSGFLQMGHRPVILENSPGQKMVYALSVVSARALYRQAEAGVGIGEELPAPAPEVPGPAEASDSSQPAVAPIPGQPVVSPVRETLAASLGTFPAEAALPALPAQEPPGDGTTASPAEVLVAGAAAPEIVAPAVASGLGRQAAESLRSGIGLVALVGAAAAIALLRAARRQLELSGTNMGGG